MEDFVKKLIATLIAALAFTVCGVILMFTFSVLYNSRQSLEGMIQQENIQRSLQQQNEEYYNEIYSRYDQIINDLTDYQKLSNGRLDRLETEVEKLKQQVTELQKE